MTVKDKTNLLTHNQWSNGRYLNNTTGFDSNNNSSLTIEKDYLKVSGIGYIVCRINYGLNANVWLRTINVSSKIITFKNATFQFSFDGNWKTGITISSSNNWQTVNLSYIIPEDSSTVSIAWVINSNEQDNLFYLKYISLTIQ